MSILRWTCRFLKRSGWGVLPCVWFAPPNGTPVTGPCTNSRDCLGQLPVLASPGDSTVLCKGLFLRHRVVGGRGAGERDGREKGEPDSSCHPEPTPVMLALTYSWEQSPCDLIVPQGLPLNALALGISCQHLNFLGGGRNTAWGHHTTWTVLSFTICDHGCYPFTLILSSLLMFWSFQSLKMYASVVTFLMHSNFKVLL